MTARISVPRVSPAGGAAPRTVAPVDPGLGRAAAEFGDAMLQTGRALETDRLARDLGRARVDIANSLGAARVDLATETDPEQLNARWAETVSQARERVLGSVDPRNREAAGLVFEETAGRHAVALGERAIALRQDRMLGTLAELGTALSAQPGLVDPEERAASLSQFTAQAQAAVAAGSLSPAQAVERVERQRAVLAETAAQRMLGEDPAGLVEAIDAGAFDDLPGPTRELRRRQAAAEHKRREETAAKAAVLAETEARRAVADRLATLTDVARQGRTMLGEEDLLADPRAQGLPGYAAAAAAVDLREELPGFATLTPAEQRAKIAEERGKPVGQRWEDGKLEALERTAEAVQRGWRTDPVAQAAALGIGEARELPFGAAGADWPAAFAERRRFGQSLRDEGYITQPVYFSAAERAQLKALAASDRPPEQRAALAAALVLGFGEDANGVLAGVSDDPVFRHVGGLLAGGARGDVAVQAFKGQAALEAGTATAPARDRRQEIMEQALGRFLPETFGADAAAQAGVIAAADAIFASEIAGRTIDADDDAYAQLYAGALQSALGQGVDGAGNPTGGVRDIRGRKTWLPVGTPQVEFEAVLDFATEKLEGRRFSLAAKRRGHEDVPPEDIFSRAAVDGDGEPVEAEATFGGAPLTADVAEDLQLEAVGPGIYRLRRGGYAVKDARTGGDLLVSYDRLRAIWAREARP